jgi:hypothetical protein
MMSTLLTTAGVRCIATVSFLTVVVFAPAAALDLQSAPFDVPASALADPGGAILHEQLPDGYTTLSSQLDACVPFLTECADDFVGDGSTIQVVTWWGKFWQPTEETIDGFFVRILGVGDGGAPGEVLSETHATSFVDTGEELPHYEVILDAPFVTTPGQTYFLSVVAEHCSMPQWGWATGSGNGEYSWFRSEYFGYPEWTEGVEVYGVHHELAFRLVGVPVPVVNVAWGAVKAHFR